MGKVERKVEGKFEESKQSRIKSRKPRNTQVSKHDYPSLNIWDNVWNEKLSKGNAQKKWTQTVRAFILVGNK